MNVLSLFDGISCARVALDQAGLPVKTYYACEIDKHAIAISQKNYPDIVRLGDVREVRGLTGIDLLIGGSPCQDLSIAKKDRKGLDGERSGLFWEYVRILREVKPRWFVLENVASMSKADRDIITKELGVEPVLFNAALVSAQSRKRLFWTNLRFDLPADRGIVLKDILEDSVGEEYAIPSRFTQTPSGSSKLGHVGNTDGQANRVYSIYGKSVTLSANGGGSGAKTGLYFVGHLDGSVRKGMEGQEHLSRAHRQCNRVYGTDGKAPSLSASETSGRTHVAVEPTRIRKLTPIECERLQGLPDNYTEGVAKSHRYKCLGNAFHVEVVAHILRECESSSDEE